MFSIKAITDQSLRDNPPWAAQHVRQPLPPACFVPARPAPGSSLNRSAYPDSCIGVATISALRATPWMAERQTGDKEAGTSAVNWPAPSLRAAALSSTGAPPLGSCLLLGSELLPVSPRPLSQWAAFPEEAAAGGPGLRNATILLWRWARSMWYLWHQSSPRPVHSSHLLLCWGGSPLSAREDPKVDASQGSPSPPWDCLGHGEAKASQQTVPLATG